MRKINDDVKLELKNAPQITGQQNAVGLDTLWDSFMRELFSDMDTWTRKWLTARLQEVESPILAKIKHYEQLLRVRQRDERAAQGQPKGKKKGVATPSTYAQKRRQEQQRLTTKLQREKKEVTQAAAHLRTLESTSIKTMNKLQRDAHKLKIAAAKVDWFDATKDRGLTQRKIHELYAHSISNIIKNLRKDLTRVRQYKKQISQLQMPTL